MSDNRFKNIFNFDSFISLLNEGLIHTYPIKTAKKLITRELFSLGIKFSIDIDETTNTIFIKGYSETFVGKNMDRLIRPISSCGYFPSTFEFYDKDDESIKILIYDNMSDEFMEELNENIEKSFYTQITIESKFNKVITPPNILYHVLRRSNLEKILKLGLCPRNKNKKAYHTSRIYLGYTYENTKNMANQFGKGDYSLIKIDVKNLDIVFYDDPDFTGNGCYTYNNIHPDRIELIENFNIDK